MENGKSVGLVEVKNKVTKKAISQIETQMKKFQDFHPSFKDYKVYGAIAGKIFPDPPKRRSVFPRNSLPPTVHRPAIPPPTKRFRSHRKPVTRREHMVRINGLVIQLFFAQTPRQATLSKNNAINIQAHPARGQLPDYDNNACNVETRKTPGKGVFSSLRCQSSLTLFSMMRNRKTPPIASIQKRLPCPHEVLK